METTKTTASNSRPPSIVPPNEHHRYVLGIDETRLFVRSKNGPTDASLRAYLCDGILCDGFIWKYLWEQLSEEVNVTHWNYRGHGRSAPPRNDSLIGISSLADDLSRVRESDDDPPAILIGHSMGCQVALEEWHSHRKNVRGIVLLCGSFGNVTSTFRGVPVLDMLLPKLLTVAEKYPEVVRAFWSRMPADTALKVALKMGEIDPAHIQKEDFLPYLQHMTRVNVTMFLRMLRSAGDHNAGGYLGEIDVPVLIVAGERDTFTPSFLSESMARAIPGAELVVLKGGTHCAPLEQPALVWEHIQKFIRERVAPSI